MDDYMIEQALEGLVAVADSNFPASTDIVLSTTGKNSASVTIPSLALRGLLAFAKDARDSAREAKTTRAPLS